MALKTILIVGISFSVLSASINSTSAPVYLEYENCISTAHIVGIDKNRDGFIAVRNGPSSKYKIIDKIKKNDLIVSICDSEGSWIPIIYTSKKNYKFMDCKIVNSNRKIKIKYKGPCNSGWIYKKFLTGFAD